MLIPKDVVVHEKVMKAAEEGVAIAELEYLGLSLRVINALEESLNAIYLADIVNLDDKIILSVKQLGRLAYKQIITALYRIDDLEIEREKWHRGSEKTSHYFNNVNMKSILS